MTLIRFNSSPEQQVDLSKTYDAIVVGSGAAGGMAAHVLTSQGMKVLLLEAGKKIDINAELRSMEWPYDHPRRGEAPPGDHAIRFNEYNIRKPPYAKGSAFKHVFSYVRGCSAARPISGAGWRRGSPTTTSRARRTMASARTGPFHMQILSRITTK